MQNVAPLAPEINPANRRPELGAVADLPVGFDPARHRIIATHFYGWPPIGVVTDEITSALQFRHQAKRQYARRLG